MLKGWESTLMPGSAIKDEEKVEVFKREPTKTKLQAIKIRNSSDIRVITGETMTQVI